MSGGTRGGVPLVHIGYVPKTPDVYEPLSDTLRMEIYGEVGHGHSYAAGTAAHPRGVTGATGPVHAMGATHSVMTEYLCRGPEERALLDRYRKSQLSVGELRTISAERARQKRAARNKAQVEREKYLESCTAVLKQYEPELLRKCADRRAGKWRFWKRPARIHAHAACLRLIRMREDALDLPRSEPWWVPPDTGIPGLRGLG